jgi:hypothetical protein
VVGDKPGVAAKDMRVGNVTDIASMWRSANPSAAAELLFSRNGGAKALQIARLEMQKARRARSRKRFDFWTAVARQMEEAIDGSGDDAAGRQ